MVIRLILMIIFIVATVVFVILAGREVLKKSSYNKKPMIIYTTLATVGILGAIFIPGNIHQVNTGEVAVVRHLGKVSGIREAGIYWDFYMTNQYEIYDTKVREINIETQTYSKDNQIIGVTANLQYTIDTANVDKIATEYGAIEKLESKINSIALDNIKSVFAKNTATDVINNRSEISANISQTVNNSINQAYYVSVKTIVLTNIDFTDDFEAAVAAKVAAAQEAEKAENEARKAEIEAEAAKQVAILKAEAELEQAKLAAQAKFYAAEQEAQAQMVLAQAEANATKLKAVAVARMVGFEVIETQNADGTITYDINYGPATTAEEIKSRDERIALLTKYLEYVQYLEKWDGTLPVTLVGDDTATIVIPSTN